MREGRSVKCYEDERVEEIILAPLPSSSNERKQFLKRHARQTGTGELFGIRHSEHGAFSNGKNP